MFSWKVVGMHVVYLIKQQVLKWQLFRAPIPAASLNRLVLAGDVPAAVWCAVQVARDQSGQMRLSHQVRPHSHGSSSSSNPASRRASVADAKGVEQV